MKLVGITDVELRSEADVASVFMLGKFCVFRVRLRTCSTPFPELPVRASFFRLFKFLSNVKCLRVALFIIFNDNHDYTFSYCVSCWNRLFLLFHIIQSQLMMWLYAGKVTRLRGRVTPPSCSLEVACSSQINLTKHDVYGIRIEVTSKCLPVLMDLIPLGLKWTSKVQLKCKMTDTCQTLAHNSVGLHTDVRYLLGTRLRIRPLLTAWH